VPVIGMLVLNILISVTEPTGWYLWWFYDFIIIIITTITIWHYNTLWLFAFSAKSLQVLLSLAASFQFLTFSFLGLP
jgi:hypothetical protein